MSDFKQSLRKMDISALPYVAGQLLQQLGQGAGADFRARREMPETLRQDGADSPQRSFTDFEKSETQREFLQTARAEGREFGFDEAAEREDKARDFASAELSETAQRSFAEGANYPRRVFPDMQLQGLSENRGISGRADRPETGDAYAAMEEISEFFRRDGRRYDGGFRQY